MGISADLIQFCNDGDHIIDDLNDQNLYEYFPSNMHHLIYKTDVEIYDLDYYKELYNNLDLYVASVGYDGLSLSKKRQSENMSDEELDQWYHELIVITDPKVKVVQCNAINYKSLGYIGGKEAFIKTIFKLYNKKEFYPYLWTFEENIVKDKKSWVFQYNDQPFVYINLNY